MKKFVVHLGLILLLVSAANADIQGIWKLPEENTEVEFKKYGEIYKGVIVNSDKQKAIGKVLFRDLKEKDGKYIGKFYAIRKDRLVDVEITPQGDVLDIEISAGFRSKNMKCTRIR
jgi:uncharacterized protein (DUF2147 family)